MLHRIYVQAIRCVLKFIFMLLQPRDGAHHHGTNYVSGFGFSGMLRIVSQCCCIDNGATERAIGHLKDVAWLWVPKENSDEHVFRWIISGELS